MGGIGSYSPDTGSSPLRNWTQGHCYGVLHSRILVALLEKGLTEVTYVGFPFSFPNKIDWHSIIACLQY